MCESSQASPRRISPSEVLLVDDIEVGFLGGFFRLSLDRLQVRQDPGRRNDRRRFRFGQLPPHPYPAERMGVDQPRVGRPIFVAERALHLEECRIVLGVVLPRALMAGDDPDLQEPEGLVERRGRDRHEPVPVFQEEQVSNEVVPIPGQEAKTLEGFGVGNAPLEEIQEPLLETPTDRVVGRRVQERPMRPALVAVSILPGDEIVSQLARGVIDFDRPDDLSENAALADVVVLPVGKRQQPDSLLANGFLLVLPLCRQSIAERLECLTTGMVAHLIGEPRELPSESESGESHVVRRRCVERGFCEPPALRWSHFVTSPLRDEGSSRTITPSARCRYRPDAPVR